LPNIAKFFHFARVVVADSLSCGKEEFPVHSRVCIFLPAFIALVLFCPLTTRAARLGHPGVSTRAATSAQNQWNIICDPQYVTGGSTSTMYDPTVASLFEVTGVGPYIPTQVNVQIVENFETFFNSYTSTAGMPIFISIPSDATETGLAQVLWTLNGSPPPDSPDDNTHMLIFNNITSNKNALGTFTDYMDAGSLSEQGQTPTPDSYSGFFPDSSTKFTYSANPFDPNFQTFTTETVTFAAGTPEPASIALIAVLASGGLLKRRRRMIVRC